jgi:hypothetical protein
LFSTGALAFVSRTGTTAGALPATDGFGAALPAGCPGATGSVWRAPEIAAVGVEPGATLPASFAGKAAFESN